MDKRVFIIIGVVLVVLISAGGAYMLLQKDGKTNQNSDTTKTATTDTPTKKYTDACKVFTSEQIATALGGKYGNGEEEYAASTATPGSPNYDDLQGSACSFDQDNDGTTTGMTNALGFTITISNYENTAAAHRFMKDLHDPQTSEGQAAIDTPVDVDNVGDQAFFSILKVAEGVNDKTDSLYVRIGRQVILLSATRLSGIDHEVVRAGLVNLAKNL